jgi:Fur family peroxide stress response transcriptional regulator
MFEMSMLNDFVEVLHRNGYKATAQRLEILKILTESREHPTAEEVYVEVREKFPTISRATVYKTIQVLKEAGRVQELAFYDKKTRFDPSMQPHINMVCLKCGRIEDVIDPSVEELIQRISNEQHFKMEGQRIDFYGTCMHCREGTKD